MAERKQRKVDAVSPAEMIQSLAEEVHPKRQYLTKARLQEETRGFVRRGDWGKASSAHFVELFAILHEEVYGVVPEDLDSKSRGRAKVLVGRLIRTSFDGDHKVFAEFVFWLWRREKGRETWRRENHRDGGRLSWQTAFNRSSVTDFRVSGARRIDDK